MGVANRKLNGGGEANRRINICVNIDAFKIQTAVDRKRKAKWLKRESIGTIERGVAEA